MSPPSAFKYLNKLQGQRVLILGGSSGIGFAVAEAAVEHGAKVIISSSNPARVQSAIERLQKHAQATQNAPDGIHGKACDVANADTVERNLIDLLDFSTAEGKLDHVVYTAGNGISIPILANTSLDEIYAASIVRQHAPTLLAKHLPNYVTQSTNSSFTLTSGSYARRPGQNWSIIAGIGAAVEGLTRGFAVDIKPIRVNAVRLGIIPTEFFEHIPEEQRQIFIEASTRDNVMGKLGKPEEVAEAYLYSLKDTFATGSIITTNGGQLIGRSDE
ncbi:unnamed protein product [Clonostachys rosea f. rosea IK726]|uniref:Short chain dehydrogenase n=2 Tax=Bionectria ochroleuca TaxID=29856 RepID=A0A0B7K349_BIOOC|nr:unnamed protein product [Clonostachys rosea f. rosea IK726]